MSSTPGAGSYRALMADRPLRRAFLVSLTGRFGYALLPLCLLFSIAQSSDSFALAATATATFGLGGLLMPVQARLLDRRGQRFVLPAVGLWFTTFVTVAAVAAAKETASPTFWLTLCLVAGAGAPSLGPAMRAQWREATTSDQRESAYALDAIAEEVVFLIGPLGASGILLLGPAWWGVAATAVVIPIGVAGLAGSPYRPPPRRAVVGGSGWLGPFRRSGFRRLLLMMGLAGISASAWLTVLAGMADTQRRPSLVGIVEAATGLTSILGALWWGRRRSMRPWPKELRTLTIASIPLAIACLLTPSLWTIALTLTVTGFVMAPTYVVAYAASDHETDEHHHTEASTWVNSVTNVGTSLGAAASAWLYTQAEPAAVFALILVLLATAATIAASTHERDTTPAAP